MHLLRCSCHAGHHDLDHHLDQHLDHDLGQHLDHRLDHHRLQAVHVQMAGSSAVLLDFDAVLSLALEASGNCAIARFG